VGGGGGVGGEGAEVVAEAEVVAAAAEVAAADRRRHKSAVESCSARAAAHPSRQASQFGFIVVPEPRSTGSLAGPPGEPAPPDEPPFGGWP